MVPERRPHPEVVLRHVGSGAVLVHLQSNHVFELNETGRRVWEELVAGQPVASIVQTLVSEFDVSADSAHESVDRLMSELHALGLVV